MESATPCHDAQVVGPYRKSCHKGANGDFECHCIINSLLTEDCTAFLNVSVFGVHTENGSFSECTIFEFMRYH